MVIVDVSLVAGEDVVALETALRQVVAEARACEGCTRYEWYRHPDDPRAFFVFGAFESEVAFERYRQGPVVRRIGATILPLLAAPPRFTHARATVMAAG